MEEDTHAGCPLKLVEDAYELIWDGLHKQGTLDDMYEIRIEYVDREGNKLTKSWRDREKTFDE